MFVAVAPTFALKAIHVVDTVDEPLALADNPPLATVAGPNAGAPIVRVPEPGAVELTVTVHEPAAVVVHDVAPADGAVTEPAPVHVNATVEPAGTGVVVVPSV